MINYSNWYVVSLYDITDNIFEFLITVNYHTIIILSLREYDIYWKAWSSLSECILKIYINGYIYVLYMTFVEYTYRNQRKMLNNNKTCKTDAMSHYRIQNIIK